MKTLITTFVLAILLLGSTCKKEGEDCHKTIMFANQIDNTLYVTLSYGYPDTLAIYNNPSLVPNQYKVLPNETNEHSLSGRECIELEFNYSIPSDTLMVYVFDANVLETIPWETVISDNLILKRYDLSLEDLQDSDWTITYP